jgi:centromere protein I
MVTSRCELDQASTTALVRHLFPAGSVSAEAVTVIVGSLGQGASKPTPATQTELVRWLVNAREAVDGTALSRLYGVLFSLLDTLNLRYNHPSSS